MSNPQFDPNSAEPPERERPPDEAYAEEARRYQSQSTEPPDRKPSPLEAAIAELAKMPLLEYSMVRKGRAKELGLSRVSDLDAAVESARKAQLFARIANAAPPPKIDVPCPSLDSDPLVMVDNAIKLMGYGGDRKLPILLYLCCTTRLLSFNAGSMLAHGQVVGAASSGKNYAINTALGLMPKEVFIKIDAGSPKALIYTDHTLQHKIVVFTEADSLPISEVGGKSLADGDSRSTAASALRNLASDGYLSYDIVERSPEGQFVTRHIRKDGPTLLLTTTTKAISGQMGTRLWEMPVLETDEQLCCALSARVSFELTRQQHNPGDLVAYQAHLQGKAPWDVIVPFAKELRDGLIYDGMNPRILRDFERILSLIKAVTVLRYKSRACDNSGRLMATLDDYGTVRDVLNDCYAVTVSDGLNDDVRTVVTAVKALYEPQMDIVTYLDVAKKIGWNDMRVRRKVAVALKHGWLINQQDKPRRPAHLKPGDDVPVSRGLPEKEKLISSPLHPSETPVDVLTGQAPTMDGVGEPAGDPSTSPVNTPSTLPIDGDVDGDIDGSILPDGDGVNSQSTRQHDIRQDEDVEFYFSAIDEPPDPGPGYADSLVESGQPAAATPPASTPSPPLEKPPKLPRDARTLARLLVHYRGFELVERLARRLRWEGAIGDTRVLAAAYELEKAGLAVVSNSSVKLRRIGEVRPGVSTHEIPPQNDCKRANALPAADYTDAPLAADDFEEGTL